MKQLSGPITLIKQALTIFFKKENLIYLLKINLFILPLSILSRLLGYSIGPNTDLSNPTNIIQTVLVAIVNLAYVLVYVWVIASGIEAVRRIIMGEPLDVPSTFKVGWKKYIKFSLLGLSLFLIVSAGFILLIIPGVIFIIWFTFSKYMIIDSEIGIKDALIKSKQLVTGRFFQVFGRVLVFGLFSMLTQITISLIPYVGVHLLELLGLMFVLPSYLLYEELTVGKELSTV